MASVRKGYYDKVYTQRSDGSRDYVYFVGEKSFTSDIKSGYKVPEYTSVDRDHVTVTLPKKSRTGGKWPDDVAEVNWNRVGSRDPALALDYGRLITRAARFAAKAQADFDAKKEV